MQWMKSRETAIREAEKREDTKIRELLSSLFAAIPAERWKRAETKWNRFVPFNIRRTHLTAVTDSGVQVNIVREVLCDRAEEDIPVPNEVACAERRYQVYFEHVLMASEEYTKEEPPAGSIGALFETYSSQ